MKTKKILSILVLMIVSCCFVCLGCDKKKEDNPQPPAEGPTEIVLNGIEVTSIQILDLEDNFTCDMTVKNESEEDVLLDLSKLVFKSKDSISLEHDGGEETIYANDELELVLLIDAGTSGLKEGDSVSVYYDGEFLKEVTIEEF